MDFFFTKSNPGANVTVTKDEFLLFHDIDRLLFSRLVVELDRETSQSMHVMAFILWVEKKIKNLKIVQSLLNWPRTSLSNLADEVNVALSFIEGADFPSFTIHENPFPLIQSIMGKEITLQYFHCNRMEIIIAVTKILNDVCVNAFADIVQQVHNEKALKQQIYPAANYYGYLPYNSYHMQQDLYYTLAHGVAFVPQQIAVVVPHWNELGHFESQHDESQLGTYDASRNLKFNEDITLDLVNLDFTEVYDDATKVNIASDKGKGKEVTKEERTIFMTFSKGYPIFEADLRQYFTSKYGEVVESVLMEDVVPPAQPSFARLVILPEAKEVIDNFLTPAGRLGFTINGKHVWARKYVRWSNVEAVASSSS
ncbi:uncharacterized protein LOC130712577 [Lotus japonicus]|uniref:uncharacterized protein LOC130712577 n=1 Tax=Lotus japonicus TaxID=34305 RepID=UPI00258DB2D4|nr:uncharacterized protein LOC130712577 [Lotus japonicus]